MFLLPSDRIAILLRSEPGGIWIEPSANIFRFWLVAKLQTFLIREIDAGANIALNVWVIESDGASFAAFGFSVYDDAVRPKVIYGACRSTEEIDNLRILLGMTTVPLQLYNENELALFNATCMFDPEKAASVVAALPAGDYPAGDGIFLRRRALDILQASMVNDAAIEPRIVAQCQLPLDLVRKERMKATVLGVGDFTIDNADQGNELERLTFQLFDALFTFGAYHSPKCDHAHGRREVCDVLALSRVRQVKEEGIFVIQNKVANTDGKQRTLERRGLTIQRNILRGLGQALGAVKNLQDGIRVYRSDGSRIEADPPEIAAVTEPLNLHERAKEVGYGIVLVSDLHEGVDWQAVWENLREASRETGYFFHVLDLRELHGLIVNANGLPAIFESYLIERWTRMAEQKNALVRFRFIV